MLHSKYTGNCKYRVENIFLFDWESDFFVVKDNRYCYEFEIKISRSDFFSDSKKVSKHSVLSKGIKHHKKTRWVDDGLFKGWKEEIELKQELFRPNKFYYVTPADLIKANEVPEYAGLMYVNGGCLDEIKKAPFIHKDIIEVEKKLCNKFFYYWLEERRNRIRLEQQIEIKLL